MSEIVKLNGGMYEYKLPPVPKDERDILFYDKPKKDQYWVTPKILKDFKGMSAIKREEYIHYWREKSDHGLWFFNKGIPTYITGMHVDHLVFHKQANKNFLYMKSQRLRFYFRDLTNNDTLCDGRLWAKARRTGITSEERTEAVRCLLADFGNHVGLQSTKDNIVMRTLMAPIIDIYFSRPKWMRESVDMPNGRKPKKTLKLADAKISDDKDDDSLQGYIIPFATVADAFDSDEWMLCVLDEFSKWTSCNPRESFDIAKKAASNPGKQGKIDCLSTSGDSKEAVRSVIEWHKLIAESDPSVRDMNGKTISGLYKYFVGAVDSFFVMEELTKQGKINHDKYGDINLEMTEEWIWNEHRKFQVGTKDYIFSLYKLPMEESHVLLSTSVANIFSRPRIASRLMELTSLPPDMQPWVRGSLVEMQNGKVKFEADPSGIWYWAVQPYFSIEKNIDTRNRFRKIDGVYLPPVNPEGAIGYDSIDFSKENTKSTHLSQVAISIHKKFDYFKSGVADVKMAFALWRPDDPRDANYEVMKACKFTGYPCMHERSANHVYEDFRDNNMLPFLMKEGGLYGLVMSSKVINDGVTMLKSRYRAPEEGEVDQILIHPFADSLRSLDNFDPSNTTQFDAAMSELILEHGLKQLNVTNRTDANAADFIKWANEIIPPRA